MNRASTFLKQNFTKVSHVIFDLDGLLLDSEGVYLQANRNIVERFGRDYSAEICRQVLGKSGQDLCANIVKLLELPVTPEEYMLLKRVEEKTLHLDDCNLKPGAEKIVRHLHQNKIPMAVATSSSKESFKLKTQKHENFFTLFNHVVTGASDPEVKKGKPSPDIFLVCARRFSDNPDPSKCLVFEDAPNGVIAAKDAGMQSVMIPDPDIVTPEFQHASLVLISIEEFKPELFGLPAY